VWNVDKGQIRDLDGRSVILRGANVAGAHKQKPYLGSFEAKDYARLKTDWGFDAIRLLVIWAGLEPQKDQYDEGYLDEIEKRVSWAHDADLLVVVDLHQDVFGEGFSVGDGAPRWACDEAKYAAFQPKTPWFLSYLDPGVLDCFERFWTDDALRGHVVEGWRRLAKRLAKWDNVIGFDPLNEPHWGRYAILGFEPDRLAPFYEDVTKVVRAEAPQWLVFAEPSSSRNIGYPTQLTKFSFDRVVYSPHAYDNDAESGSGFDATHRDAMTKKIGDLRAEADALGAALWIGEYGGMPGTPGIQPYMDAVLDAAGAAAAGNTYWAYDLDDAGYSFLKADRTEKKDLVDAITRPYPMRVAGDLLSYSWDDAGNTTTISFAPNPEIKSPTTIAVPLRAAPNGVDVDCGGCTVDSTPGLIRLMSPPPGEKATVILRAK